MSLRTLPYASRKQIFWFVFCICLWKKPLYFWYLVPLIKVWRVWFICWNHTFWELVISFFYNCFTFLNEINLWAWVFLFFFILIGFYGVCVLNFDKSCVDLVLWYNLDNICCVTPWCAFLICFVFCSNYIFIWFLKVLCMHIYYMYILWHACFLWSNIYGKLHKILNWLRCAWNLISYLYAHIYVEFVICIVVYLTTLDPISLGTVLYLILC